MTGQQEEKTGQKNVYGGQTENLGPLPEELKSKRR